MPPNEQNPKTLALGSKPDPESRAETPRRRTKDELDFLPAAIEIMETPASPAARAVALTLVAFFSLAVLSAILAKVEVAAFAQ